jgi:hypothetical protein
MKLLAIILLTAILVGCISGGAYIGSGGHYGVGVGVGI